MYKYIKRFIDTIIAFIFLIILFIPMCVVAICIKLEDGGPVFYKQTRIGKDLKPFKIQIFASILTVITALLILYVVFYNWDNNSLSDIENPIF